jgi:hypothetical protein
MNRRLFIKSLTMVTAVSSFASEAIAAPKKKKKHHHHSHRHRRRRRHHHFVGIRVTIRELITVVVR